MACRTDRDFVGAVPIGWPIEHSTSVATYPHWYAGRGFGVDSEAKAGSFRKYTVSIPYASPLLDIVADTISWAGVSCECSPDSAVYVHPLDG